MDEVLAFLGECWKDLDRPAQVQLDNARELAGWGPAARTLSRVIRLFQPRLFQRLFQRPTDLRQELARLQEAVNTQHVHPRLRDQTPAQHRKGLRLAKLPPGFVVPAGRLPLSAGRVIFIRRVSPAGTV